MTVAFLRRHARRAFESESNDELLLPSELLSSAYFHILDESFQESHEMLRFPNIPWHGF